LEVNPEPPSMPPNRPSFESGRRLRTGFSVAVAVASLVAIVAMVNFLAVTRKVWRYDVTANDVQALSPLTLATLAAMTNDVKVTVLFNPEDDLYPHVDSMLREYAARTPHLQVQVIDYLRNPGAAELAKVRYKLGPHATDLIVFDAGNRQRVVGVQELSQYNADDTQAIMAGDKDREIRRSGFTGEARFTSALAALLDGAEARACYLTGHGEHPPDSDDPLMGYAKFLRLLSAEKNLAIETLKLGAGTNEIPADCQLLIIAGPTGPFLGPELAKIEAFLQRGGRLLALLHPYAVGTKTGLEALLQRWGIAAPPVYAGDEQFSSYTKLDVITKDFGGHPLTAPLRREGGALYFPLPRVVAPMPANLMPADAPKADVLVTTSEHGFTRSNIKDGNAAFDPVNDIKGKPIPLAAASEKGGVSGIATGRGTTRVVAIGDSTMFANDTLDKPGTDAGNRDFAALTVSWLLDRPQALAIGPKLLHEYRLHLTGSQLRTLRWTLLAGLPGSMLLVGFVVWFRRRS
jgi:hypothetical protein